MNLTFNLSIVQDCVLQIKDTTRECNNSEYLEESSNMYIKLGQFKYSETYTINVIKYKNYNSETAEIIDTIITSHVDNDNNIILDEAYHNLQKDGHYIIEHLVIPNINLVDKLIKLEENNAVGTMGINDYDNFYVTDGINFYKFKNDNLESCDIIEILNVNPLNSNISKTYQETFSICFLHKCYLEHCKNEIQGIINVCVPNTVSYISNLIWICINAIKYNIEFGQLEHAQSILENLLRCGGFCKSIKSQKHDCCK